MLELFNQLDGFEPTQNIKVINEHEGPCLLVIRRLSVHAYSLMLALSIMLELLNRLDGFEPNGNPKGLFVLSL
jgi:hypothetical protein